MNRAEKAYSAFAAERGLKPLERYEVGPLTPLLADVYETHLGPRSKARCPAAWKEWSATSPTDLARPFTSTWR